MNGINCKVVSSHLKAGRSTTHHAPVEEEDSSGKQGKGQLSQWTDEGHDLERPAARLDPGANHQVGKNEQCQNDESTDSQSPAKSHFRYQLDHHDWKDDPSQR